MGMKQRRCPVCKKKRPYNEGAAPHERERRESRWKLIAGEWVCMHCVNRRGAELQTWAWSKLLDGRPAALLTLERK